MRKQIIQVILAFRKLLRRTFDQYSEHWPFIIPLMLALIAVVGGINLFVDLTETLHSEVLARYDQKITDFVISFRTPGLTKFLQFITNVGDLYGYIVITVLISSYFYLRFKNWRFGLEVIFVTAIASLSNLALKQVINRARPDAEHLVSVATLSYPSGHAMSAMAFYGFLIYLFYSFRLKAWVKTVFILIFVFLILSIGISRIYLGVHYPSDVVGGYIAGFIWVIFCVVLFHIIDLIRKRRGRKNNQPQEEIME